MAKITNDKKILEKVSDSDLEKYAKIAGQKFKQG
jgi:hypothetical protein